MPGDEYLQAFRIELDELAVQHALIGIHADLTRPKIDSVDVFNPGSSDDPSSLRQDLHLTGPLVVHEAKLVGVHEIDPVGVPDPEADEADNDSHNKEDARLDRGGNTIFMIAAHR